MGGSLEKLSMEEVIAVARALSDPNRVRSLAALSGGELCVCQIIELLGLAPSTVSKHMSILHQAGLVDVRKVGKWVYYRLAGEGASTCVRDSLAWVRCCLARDAQILKDSERLPGVRKVPQPDGCEECGC